MTLAVFLFPLSIVADRFCWFAPTDDLYHALVALHIVLPQILIAAAIVSSLAVIYRVSTVQSRLEILTSLASESPLPLRMAFQEQARSLAMTVPQLVYVPASLPLCFTAFTVRAAKVFVSRGFVDALDDRDLRLVARHELVHIRERHAAWNFFWHVAFAALVLPGFAGLESTLRLRRETRANVAAARLDPQRYEVLLLRSLHGRRSLCAEGDAPNRSARSIAFVGPVGVLLFLAALAVSHVGFMHDLPYLTTHHC